MTESKLNNLFFALWPDTAVRDGLVHLQYSIYGQNGRMQHPDDLHMTLVFMGRITSEQIACARNMADKIRVEPFTLELSMVGYWKRPRILWCSPDAAPEPLSRLVYDLQQGLSACGVRPEERPYKPHVTLARKAVAVGDRFLEEPVVWAPHEFVLAGSHSGTGYPHYLVLDRWSMER